MRVKNIEDVTERQLCCGCGACAYVDPESFRMADTLEFGRRPVKTGGGPESPDALAACPGAMLAHGEETKAPGLDAGLLPGWGPVLTLMEGNAADEEIRFKGSSGGAVTALSLFGLERRGMRGVLHVAPRDGAPYFNATVLSDSRAKLLNGIGSRYAPASPCDGLGMVESAGGPCVVVGKPCDVAAVGKAARLRPGLAANAALTISIFCAGTPSNAGVRKMLDAFGVSDLRSVEGLRYRGYGWPGMTEVALRNGDKRETKRMTYDESWGGILQEKRQWRCYICPDHTGEFADISVGDPWYRSDKGTNPGRSLILARTPRGREFLEAALAAGYLEAEPVESSRLPESQPHFIRNKGSLWGRLAMLRLFGVPVTRYRGFPMFRFFLGALSLKEKAKAVLGTPKRIVVKKLLARHRIVPINDL